MQFYKEHHVKFSLAYKKEKEGHQKMCLSLATGAFLPEADSGEGDCNKNLHLPNPYALRGTPRGVSSDMIKDKQSFGNSQRSQESNITKVENVS